MMAQGFVLMAAGMGTVFVFLSLMVLVMQAVGTFFRRYADRFVDPIQPALATSRTESTELELVAAVVAAVTAHRGA